MVSLYLRVCLLSLCSEFSVVWGSNFALVNKQWFLIVKELTVSHSNVHINYLFRNEDEDEDDEDEDEYEDEYEYEYEDEDEDDEDDGNDDILNNSNCGHDDGHNANINDGENDDNKCLMKRSLSCGGQQQQQQQLHKKQKISYFKILTKESVQHINVALGNIGDCFEKINQCTSLRSITVINSGNIDYGESVADYPQLEVLNNLKRIDEINVNFFLNIKSYYERGIEIQAITFKFKTLHFYVYHDIDRDYGNSLNFIYELINLLRPNSVELYSDHSFDDGASHLNFFHSLSKLSFESVVIDSDYIPLYSLYRFLRSTRLTVFKFRLQFHFLSALYYSNDDDDNDNDDDDDEEISYDFNTMDTTDGDDINEDTQVYCTYGRYGPSNSSIPYYSRSLWKECLQLLKTNTTITELSIGNSVCGEECFEETLNQQLIDDLLDSLSNNRSIKTLCLDFNVVEIYDDIEHPFINADFISSLLQNNTTIENLYIRPVTWNYTLSDKWKSLLDVIVESKPSNSKCLIDYVPKTFQRTSMLMSYQFSSKAYQ
ncbi:hypothetical protein CYY_002885 [Polysphondylium violaceum]|uniref:Uncharacterized protein n=1 Tax=Polysphondylium violaceum TaxID=133409 RepID=A0A8J4PZE6_9MYCE|nr:hypothetical protein CYY_002885 [Polysphondylium violaceum]